MDHKIRVDASACVVAAASLLILPVKWWGGALLAAGIHELAHLCAIELLGGRVFGVSISAGGARIEADIGGKGREALCALSGPLGSFFMIFFIDVFPEAALCGLVQGLYNLIPIYPMDGGRLLRCVLSEHLCAGIEGFTLVMLWGMGIWLGIGCGYGILPLLPAFGTALQLIHRKFPCKES